jgi:hypothetical protein
VSSQAPSPSAQATRGRLALALAASALAAALALGGCGRNDGEASGQSERQSGEVVDISGTDAVGENLAGSVASLVECRDWNAAIPEQKLATIADVRSQVSRQDAGINEPALTDEEAEEIFDTACAPDWAQGLRLYKLYAHAVSFAPLARELGK